MVRPNPEILSADPLDSLYEADYRAAPGAEPIRRQASLHPRTALRIGLLCLAVAGVVGAWWWIG